jgi:hypothetical protein
MFGQGIFFLEKKRESNRGKKRRHQVINAQKLSYWNLEKTIVPERTMEDWGCSLVLCG